MLVPSVTELLFEGVSRAADRAFLNVIDNLIVLLTQTYEVIAEVLLRPDRLDGICNVSLNLIVLEQSCRVCDPSIEI